MRVKDERRREMCHLFLLDFLVVFFLVVVVVFWVVEVLAVEVAEGRV